MHGRARNATGSDGGIGEGLEGEFEDDLVVDGYSVLSDFGDLGFYLSCFVNGSGVDFGDAESESLVETDGPHVVVSGGHPDAPAAALPGVVDCGEDECGADVLAFEYRVYGEHLHVVALHVHGDEPDDLSFAAFDQPLEGVGVVDLAAGHDLGAAPMLFDEPGDIVAVGILDGCAGHGVVFTSIRGGPPVTGLLGCIPLWVACPSRRRGHVYQIGIQHGRAALGHGTPCGNRHLFWDAPGLLGVWRRRCGGGVYDA